VPLSSLTLPLRYYSSPIVIVVDKEEGWRDGGREEGHPGQEEGGREGGEGGEEELSWRRTTLALLVEEKRCLQRAWDRVSGR